MHLYFSGAWKAVREIFPNTMIKGCAFHFSQAIWRKTQELGLATTYIERGPEYRYIRSLLAFPFLPYGDIVRAFELLEPRANSVELQQLTRCLRSTWVENPVWVPKSWSVHQQSVRTNNDVEGWHTRLIANAGCANLSFYILVPLLWGEADLVDSPIAWLLKNTLSVCTERSTVICRRDSKICGRTTPVETCQHRSC